jgi:hypothetical protein
MFSMLRSWFNHRSASKATARRRQQKKTWRPQVEGLEDRAVPALLVGGFGTGFFHPPAPSRPPAGGPSGGGTGGNTGGGTGGQTSVSAAFQVDFVRGDDIMQFTGTTAGSYNGQHRFIAGFKGGARSFTGQAPTGHQVIRSGSNTGANGGATALNVQWFANGKQITNFNQVKSGMTLTVTFDTAANAKTTQFSLVSYWMPTQYSALTTEIEWADSTITVSGAGHHTLTVAIP